jgi:hypothetical protein
VFAVVVPNDVEKTPVEELYASGYVAEIEVEPSFPLKVFQSVLERYPFALVFACEIEIAFEEIVRGADALVMRLRYAVFQSVVEAVSGIEKPAVKLSTPVPLVYVSPVAVFEIAACARALVK